MKLSVIGCGYVGLVAAACLAGIGHTVVGTDSDERKIRMLKEGKLPIFEPHLDRLVARQREQGRLSFTRDPAEAVKFGDVLFLCVGTPSVTVGEADLSGILGLAQLIARESRSSKLVVTKSTVPTGVACFLKGILDSNRRGAPLALCVASNPEFMSEGMAVFDFLHPDRIVVGTEEPLAADILREIYRPILDRTFHCPVHVTCSTGKFPPFIVVTLKEAELIKHATNSFLALKISYINIIAELCERIGTDVERVARVMGLDHRINPGHLRAGLGFGGSCLTKDLPVFIRMAERVGVDFALLREAERINGHRLESFLRKVRNALGPMKDKEIGILGLAFKANTDDIRFSLALELIKRLSYEPAKIRAYDPQAMEKTRALFPKVRYHADAYGVAERADALLIATDWEEFRGLDWPRIHDLMKRPLVFDGRNLLDPVAMKTVGFEYYSVGRPELDGMMGEKKPRAGMRRRDQSA